MIPEQSRQVIPTAEPQSAMDQEEAAEHFMLWGANAVEMHDRIWASRGVQVVRAGMQALLSPAAPLYLLLDEKQMTMFDCGEVLKILHWRKPRVVRVRTRDPQSESYQEVVRFDDEGVFLAVDRDYGAAKSRIGRCWITPDRTVASRWCSAASVKEAIIELRDTVERRNRAYISVNADDYPEHARDADDRAGWIERALARSSQLSLVFDRAYQFAPGVWVHGKSVV